MAKIRFELCSIGVEEGDWWNAAEHIQKRQKKTRKNKHEINEKVHNFMRNTLLQLTVNAGLMKSYQKTNNNYFSNKSMKMANFGHIIVIMNDD